MKRTELIVMRDEFIHWYYDLWMNGVPPSPSVLGDKLEKVFR